MQINAEATQSLNTVGRVGDAMLAKQLERVLGKRRQDRGFDFGAVENGIFKLTHLAVLANARRRALDQKQVAAVAVNQTGEPVIETFGAGSIVGTRGLVAVQFACDLIEVESFAHECLTWLGT